MRDQESNYMEGLLQSLNGIEDGTDHSMVDITQSKNETLKLLEGLSSIGLEYGNLTTPENDPDSFKPNRQLYEYQEDFDHAEKLAEIYGNSTEINESYEDIPSTYIKSNIVQQPITHNHKTEWSLVENKVQGTKNTKTYSVKSNYSGNNIMDNIMMFEAAQTLVNLLNEGKTLTDPKILGIISSGLQFTQVMKEALSASKKRNKVLNESRYDEAKELDVVIAEKKAEALRLRERVMTFLINEGYITK